MPPEWRSRDASPVRALLFTTGPKSIEAHTQNRLSFIA